MPLELKLTVAAVVLATVAFSGLALAAPGSVYKCAVTGFQENKSGPADLDFERMNLNRSYTIFDRGADLMVVGTGVTGKSFSETFAVQARQSLGIFAVRTPILTAIDSLVLENKADTSSAVSGTMLLQMDDSVNVWLLTCASTKG